MSASFICAVRNDTLDVSNKIPRRSVLFIRGSRVQFAREICVRLSMKPKVLEISIQIRSYDQTVVAMAVFETTPVRSLDERCVGEVSARASISRKVSCHLRPACDRQIPCRNSGKITTPSSTFPDNPHWQSRTKKSSLFLDSK